MESRKELWDSESRFSPFSVVANPHEDFCEECDSLVDYTDPSLKHGKCKCPAEVTS